MNTTRLALGLNIAAVLSTVLLGPEMWGAAVTTIAVASLAAGVLLPIFTPADRGLTLRDRLQLVLFLTPFPVALVVAKALGA